MRVLFIGDLYGNPGIEIFENKITELKKQYRPDILIVNGENIANGRGITKEIYLKLMKLSVNAITMGNWTFGNKDIFNFIDDSNIIRPANYLSAPGKGFKVININGKRILIINLLGRIFMDPNLPSPFLVVDEIIQANNADYIFIDMHAEASSEKIALGHYLDGRVDAVVGTHTHVQTNDDRLLPNGTLYITDVGMTGPLDGIIGVDKEIAITRFKTGYARANLVQNGKKQLNGVYLDLDKKTIEKIHLEME